MTKVIVLNYKTEEVTIVTISNDLIDQYNGFVSDCLIENAKCYNDDCDFLELDTDKFGNFVVGEEVLDTIKQ